MFKRKQTETVEAVDPTPVPLADNALACWACGISTPIPKDRSQVRWAQPEGAQVAGGGIRFVSTAATVTDQIPMTECRDCAALAEISQEILDQYPQIVTRLGPGAAGPRMTAAMHALAALDAAMPDAATISRAEAERLLRHLAEPGAMAAWVARFTPVKTAGASPTTSGTFAWSHVNAEQRQGLRTAAAQLMAERLATSAPPMLLSPPRIDPREVSRTALAITTGCLICGVGTVLATASHVSRAGGTERAAQDIWSLHAAVSAAALGARRPGGIFVTGWTCPVCQAAWERVGAIGPRTIEQALFAHLDRLGAYGDRVTVDGLRSYGGLAVDAVVRNEPAPPPNRVPFGHVVGLRQLALDIDAGGTDDADNRSPESLLASLTAEHIEGRVRS